MIRFIAGCIAAIVVLGGGYAFVTRPAAQEEPVHQDSRAIAAPTQTKTSASQSSAQPHTQTTAVQSDAGSGVSKASATTDDAPGYSQQQLLALAGPQSASVVLGDDRYTTSSAKKGYVYLCNEHKDNPGSMVNGPWIHGASWTPSEKIAIQGSVSWPNASFSNTVSGSTRSIVGNGLPVGHTTGSFPVSASDPAAQYDKNPNTISAQSLRQSLPANPVFSETPYCMGGEVGVMITGIPLFNAFDAGLRDAPAHELQDSCSGHPQGSGQYHYHSMSACFKDTSVSTVLGYALDGFPITGPKVADGKYLSTDDLDICHGIVSDVNIDGVVQRTYHYVLTNDFPYSAGCFRAKPVSYMVIQGSGPQQGGQPSGMMPGGYPPPRY